MNLIVGINGAGKSTVLDALRILLSKALPELTACSRSNTLHFTPDDIAVGSDWLYAALAFAVNDLPLTYEARTWRKETREQPNINRLIADTNDIPARSKKADEQPLAIYFSTHRAIFKEKKSTVGGQAAAFVNALANDRGLRLGEFAEWWLVQEELEQERNASKQLLAALQKALDSFLDTCSNPRAVREPQPTLLLDKNGATLDVRQLSDGERGILSLVLDVARRLAQANPGLENPLEEGKAVVLIDELDLHLHPRWQRTIVAKLTQTFPNCQFIATTHSPQILGEVPPESIILLEPGQQPYRPDQSLGMDSNWILQFLMDTSDRNILVAQQLEDIADLIEEEHYDQAQEEIDRLREHMPSDLELVKLQTRLNRLQILAE
jgi:predicted ATP-binding protein involved in virulence